MNKDETYLPAANPASKNRHFAMRYFRAWRYKRLVNDPDCGIILPMVTLLRTTNLVRLSFVQALLRDSGIEAQCLTAILSTRSRIGAFPRRLMVDEARLLAAKTILADAGELYDD